MNIVKSIFPILFILGITMSSVGQMPQNVDLSTGRINVTIPLYAYVNKGQRLSMNINLNYNTAGIKVDDIASEVGTGWTLNAGGYIRRNMIGGLDDKYPEGAMYQSGINTSDLDAFVPIGSSPQVDNTYKDNELDIFEFNFNGHHGTFCIGRNKEVIQHYDSKMKIGFSEEDMSSQNIVTRISKFTVTTEDGIAYTFDKKETTAREYDIVSTYSDNGNQPSTTTTSRLFPLSPGSVLQTFVSAWYLSSVTNTLTGESIQLQYTTIQTYEKIARDETNTTISTGNDATNHTHTTVIDRITYPRLIKILFPDQTDLILNYESNPRLDYGTYIDDYGLSDNALASVIIQKDNKIYREYDFSYKYFYKNSELSYADANTVNSDPGDLDHYWDPPRNYLRLALKELQVKNNGKVLSPYKFSYSLWSGSSGPSNSKDIVPPRLVNEKNGFGYYYPENMGDQFVLPNGLLKKIQYPTGGYTEFYYTPNDILLGSGIGFERNGLKVTSVVTYDGINHANDVTTEFTYALHDKNGNVLLDTNNDPVSSQYGKQSSVAALQKSSFVETSGSPTMDQIFQVLGALYSSRGILPGVIVSVVHRIISFFIGSSFKTIDYQIQKIGGSFNNNRFPVRYSEVEVVSKSPSKNLGKTIYTLTSFDDIPPLFSNQSPPYSQKQAAPDWCYGQPKQIKVYNKKGEMVKEVNYIYNFIYRVLNDASWYESADIEPFRVLAVKSSNFNTYKSHIGWQTDYYYPITGRLEIKSVDERNYSQDRSYHEKLTQYQYDPNTYLLKKQITTNSTGETIEKRTYYPNDYSLTGAIQSMKDNNMVAFPIASETWMYKGAEEPKIIDGSIADYEVVVNGDIKPVKVYHLQSAKSVAESTIGVFDPSRLNRNTTYFKEDGVLAYDANGILIQTYARGKTVSRIYGYNHAYSIAIVDNASNNEIAYTSFEMNEKGNWQYAGTPEPVGPSVPLAVTGDKYYNLSKGSLTKSIQGLTNGKKYKLSYWTKNSSSFSLNYSSTITKGATTEGWTYFQHVFTAGSSDVVLGGSGLIDEVRLYPVDAQMTTATFRPLIGKTSECNVSNNISYYKYDELGRLLFVQDENRNIIKKITYHDAGGSSGTGIYYNQQKSQIFTKGDCDPGYVGSSVTYTVPEKKYISTVNQEYAQDQAQADIDANGQAYANTHGSCTLASAVEIIGSEYVGMAYSLTFTNVNNSSEVYTLGLGVHANNLHMGTIPLGTYNIQVCPLINVGNAFNFLINSLYTGGTGCHNYSNISFTTPGTITVNDF